MDLTRSVSRVVTAFVAAMTLSAWPARGQQTTPVLPVPNTDTVGVDDLGRALPTHDQTGDPKPDRWVGLFYWQWHQPGERWWQNYNITEFLKTRPYFRNFEVHPAGGPDHPTWYWAEPLFGYYSSTDPWVIRKHLTMLADSGVDFLFLDYTNSSVYDEELAAFLKIARELKSAGVQVPKLTFFLNHQPEWKVHALYSTWYTKPEWQDMWFMYRGKPLLLAEPIADASKLRPGQDAAIVPTINQAFTFRKTWALFAQDKQPTTWRFMHGPDAPAALDPQGRPEQVPVNKCLGGPLNNGLKTGGASGGPGKTFKREDYSPEWLLPDNASGPFFAASWDNAEKKNAPIVLVTGWNEWKASVWDQRGVPMFGVPITPPYGYIVDEFNREFNRDLEPMRGGYFDNYFMQFLGRMRQYKGMPKPQPVSPEKTIRVDGRADDWADVTPRFFDAPDDTAPRDADGVVPDAAALKAATSNAQSRALPQVHYVNRTARNDIGVTQVARDADHVYFHSAAGHPLSPATDTGWMWLLIDADQNPKTGWHGYDLLINRTRTGEGTASVERYAGHGFDWLSAGTAKFAVGTQDLELSVPRVLFGPGPLRFDFKWADNLPATPTLADFYTDGDVAPNGRLNFRYAVGQ